MLTMLLFTPPAIVLGFAGQMYWANVTEQSTEFDDPHINGMEPCPHHDLSKCPVPVFTPGDLVRVNYTVKRNRACTIQLARVMEDIDGKYQGREQQVDNTIQTFGAEKVNRPSGYTFEIPKWKPDDDTAVCQQYDVFSRVRYICNELDKLIPRFMMTDGKVETKRVRIEVCRQPKEMK